MNSRFQKWFLEGNASAALAGDDSYFVPDVTYGDEHDYVLAVAELLNWARAGNQQLAASAIEDAVALLLNAGRLRAALRLLRSYFVLREETDVSVPLNENALVSRLKRAASEANAELARNESLRTLFLSVANDLPALKKTVGL